MAQPPVAAHHPRKGELMQALSDVGVGSRDRIDRVEDRALVMPSVAADRGLLRRMTILLGVSWGYHKSPPPPRPGRSPRMPRRLSVVLGSFAMLASTMTPAASAAAAWDPTTDMNSMYSTTLYTGAQAFWNAGSTGAGVDVAVIDTGISPVDALSTPGKVIYGPDLSFESQNDAYRNLDTNGHGTFMAGIIAGRGSGAVAGSYAGDSTNFLGVAPDARILSVKVGVADGGVDVSQVIAAIDWVVQHRTDNGMNIRVLNLSYGTDSLQSYLIDPLAFAVEQAWKAGIFVVTATGNAGYAFKTGTLTNPAFDPKVFAVGASDSMGTAAQADDLVAAFSSTGSNARSPDVVAPGAHLVSLRVPGSYIDQMYGSTGQVGSTLFRGSGTSEAAAFVSGAAALAIQRHPSITPDMLKRLFLVNTKGLAGFSTLKQGTGEVDLFKMLGATVYAAPIQWKTIDWSTGIGSLELSRGTDHLTRDGVVLSGAVDIFGHAFDSGAMALLEATGNSWSGGIWNGNSWSGNSWSGNSWSGNSWSGNSWSGNSWSGNSWSGNSWSGNSWSGNSWSGNSWSGNSWSGNSWSGNSWSGNSWSGNSWSSSSWMGVSWD
jgi:serine protease AprX